jgi:hypothetical protein
LVFRFGLKVVVTLQLLWCFGLVGCWFMNIFVDWLRDFSEEKDDALCCCVCFGLEFGVFNLFKRV